MVYFKLLLNDKRSKTDNIYPIEVRVIFNRKNTSLSTGHRIQKDPWDETLQKVAPELIQQNIFTFDELKLRLKGETSTPKQNGVLDFSNGLIKDMFAAKETGNAIIYQTATRFTMNATLVKHPDIIISISPPDKRKQRITRH